MNNDYKLLIFFYSFIIFGLFLVLSVRFWEYYLCNFVSLCPCSNSELKNIQEKNIDCV